MNTNKILNKIVEYGDHLIGRTSRTYAHDLGALKRHKNLGPEGVPESTINHLSDLADKARASSIKTRVNTGIGVGLGGAATYIGVRKHYQNKDNRILEQIDKMYQNDYN